MTDMCEAGKREPWGHLISPEERTPDLEPPAVRGEPQKAPPPKRPSLTKQESGKGRYRERERDSLQEYATKL